jgi:hypothetical protein
MMLLDDFIYYTCCLIVVLHSLSAILVITHGRCSVYAAAFLIACAMWIDLTALNLWFFLPTVIREAQTISIPASDFSGNVWQTLFAAAREVLLSSAASYLYMMLFGWFVGSMSLSNALSMWQREGCDAMDSHCHPALSGYIVRLARKVEEYVGIKETGYLPYLAEKEAEERRQAKKSCIFALPRVLHRYYLLALSPPIRLPGDYIESREDEKTPIFSY